MLGNDARPGKMQPRLVALLTNPDLLAVNSFYNPTEKFAGGLALSCKVILTLPCIFSIENHE